MLIFSLKLMINSIVLSGMSFVFITQFSNVITFFHSDDFGAYIEDKADKASNSFDHIAKINKELSDTESKDSIDNHYRLSISKTDDQQKIIDLKHPDSEIFKTVFVNDIDMTDNNIDTNELNNIVEKMMSKQLVVNVNKADLDICFKEQNAKKCEILITKVLIDNFNNKIIE